MYQQPEPLVRLTAWRIQASAADSFWFVRPTDLRTIPVGHLWHS